MDSATQAAITGAIDDAEDELFELVQEFVRTESVSPNEGEIQGIVRERLEGANLDVDAFDVDVEALSEHPGFVPPQDHHDEYAGRPNVVGRSAGEGDGRSMLLVAHCDTVPVESEEDDWLADNPAEVEWFGLWFEPSLVDPGHPIVETVQRSAALVDADPAPVGGGGSDLRCLTKYAGTPAVLFGPAGSSIHGVDEYVELDSLVTATKAIALATADWCGVASSRV